MILLRYWRIQSVLICRQLVSLAVLDLRLRVGKDCIGAAEHTKIDWSCNTLARASPRVTKNVPAFSIVAGVPAQLIKRRKVSHSITTIGGKIR